VLEVAPGNLAVRREALKKKVTRTWLSQREAAPAASSLLPIVTASYILAPL